MEEEEEEKKKEEAEKLQKKKSEDNIEIDVEEEEEKKEEEKEKKPKELQALVKVEERLKGSVPWKFYYRFFTGPGGITTMFMFLFILLAQLSRVGSDWWLG